MLGKMTFKSVWVICLLLSLAVLVFYFDFIKSNFVEDSYNLYRMSYQNRLVKFRITGDSMFPLLKKGQHVLIRTDQEPKKNDLVIIMGKIKRPAIVKRIVASSGDILGFDESNCSQGHGYNILINKQILKNSLLQPLCLSDKQINKMYQFVQSIRKGIIPENYFFVVGDNDNSIDSRSFGLIERESILGVVVRP